MSKTKRFEDGGLVAEVTTHIGISEAAVRALRAFFQWELGDGSWSDTIVEILEAPDPIVYVEGVFLEGETVDGLLDPETGEATHP